MNSTNPSGSAGSAGSAGTSSSSNPFNPDLTPREQAHLDAILKEIQQRAFLELNIYPRFF